ncbi:MAG TPA: hypothetical protein PKB09_04500, partial [Candidatus Saccharibacteria bacterium]|nr:hypothetical protein [Candidatus Saccharibacteria bacterium]
PPTIPPTPLTNNITFLSITKPQYTPNKTLLKLVRLQELRYPVQRCLALLNDALLLAILYPRKVHYKGNEKTSFTYRVKKMIASTGLNMWPYTYKISLINSVLFIN